MKDQNTRIIRHYFALQPSDFIVQHNQRQKNVLISLCLPVKQTTKGKKVSLWYECHKWHRQHLCMAGTWQIRKGADSTVANGAGNRWNRLQGRVEQRVESRAPDQAREQDQSGT